MSDIVEQIVDMVARSSVTAVTVRAQGLRVTVRKPGGPAEEPLRVSHLHEIVAPEPEPTPGPGAVSETESRDAWAIRAQRVGVFRHAEPRIGPGDTVRRGQTVGTIVAMNLPSEVRATRDGVVSGVLVDDGAPVEYDQPLFALSDIEHLPGEDV